MNSSTGIIDTLWAATVFFVTPTVAPLNIVIILRYKTFENEEIMLAYQRAEREQLYERVLLFRGGMTRHYARTNHKEFFAEMTESYVGVNDFFPFVRAELKQHDPKTFTLMEKIWGEF